MGDKVALHIVSVRADIRLCLDPPASCVIYAILDKSVGQQGLNKVRGHVMCTMIKYSNR